MPSSANIDPDLAMVTSAERADPLKTPRSADGYAKLDGIRVLEGSVSGVTYYRWRKEYGGMGAD